jgi:cell division protein FtsI (penicillin-binding protein 3)
MALRERIHIHRGQGLGPRATEKNARLALAGLRTVFIACFCLVSLKLLYYACAENPPPVLAASVQIQHARSRPDILDRNGRIIATDIRVYWLYANPKHVVDAEGTAEKLAALFPDLGRAAILKKLRADSRFEWIKRGLTPREAEKVQQKGLAGLYFLPEQQRVYPAGRAAAQILGLTDVDNHGISGIERYLDERPQTPFMRVALGQRPSLRLSLDLGVEHALAEELRQAMENYRAKAAFGLVMNVRNGEVLASVSLPDFDPNMREEATEDGHQNRILTDDYELGSVFKSFTVAMALDDGILGRSDLIDTATPLRVGRFILTDHHHQRRMSVEDVYVHSSNTGAARIALMAGIARQRHFLKRLGLLDPIDTEAGRSAEPHAPKVWRVANSMTIAYGHGIAVPPIVFARAAAALVNGGRLVEPTFLATEKDSALRRRVISKEASAAMRDLMRQVVERGTGKRAQVPGIALGGKTGTAEKVEHGRYTKRVLTTFLAAFPIDEPRFLVMVSLDDPKTNKTAPRTEAAYNAAPTAGSVIKRIAPMLGVAASNSN